MRYETVQKRIGELLGPIDWDYDFEQHVWPRGGMNPVFLEVDTLREVDDGIKRGETWEVWLSHSSRWQRVISIGMYDGWPYWRPVPSVFVQGTLGGEWHSAWDLRNARRVAPVLEETR